MAPVSIVIDDREHALENYWGKYSPKYDIPYTIARIQTGDIAIVYRGKVVISIERKTWKDLAASFRDGRLINVEKMMQLRSETNCCLFYLIEGLPCPRIDAKFGRIPMKALRAHLDHLELRDNVHILYSTSPEYSVERVMCLASSYVSLMRKQEKVDAKSPCMKEDTDIEPIVDDANCDSDADTDIDSDDAKIGSAEGPSANALNVEEMFDLDHFRPTSGVPESLTTSRRTSSDLQKTMLMCLNKIGLTRAELLLECGLTIRDFRDGISEEAFMKIAKSRKIDTKIAQRHAEVICKCRLRKSVLIKVLCCINGITESTAEILLEKVSFGDILSHNLGVLDTVTIHGKKIKAIIQKLKEAFPLK